MRTRRRILISLLAAGCAAAAPSFAETDKTLRLGAIAAGAPLTADSPLGKILIGALADLGYALGRNLDFESRGALADIAKLPGLIAELTGDGGADPGRFRLSERRRRQSRRRSDGHLLGRRRSRRDRPRRELGASRRRRSPAFRTWRRP